jgi:predicted membrane channel-forming protein YqfA (hemolysin III family)
MHFTKVGVTVGLVAVSIAFLMDSAAVNLAAAILVFLSALLPILMRVESAKHSSKRTSNPRRKQRRFFSILFQYLAVLASILIGLGAVHLNWPFGVVISIVFLYFIFCAAAFSTSDAPLTRINIAVFVAMACSAVALGSAVEGLTIVKAVSASLHRVNAKIAASPTPTPAPPPSPK